MTLSMDRPYISEKADSYRVFLYYIMESRNEKKHAAGTGPPVVHSAVNSIRKVTSYSISTTSLAERDRITTLV